MEEQGSVLVPPSGQGYESQPSAAILIIAKDTEVSSKSTDTVAEVNKFN